MEGDQGQEYMSNKGGLLEAKDEPQKKETLPLSTALIVLCNRKQNFSSVENLFIYSFYVFFCS